MPQDIHDKAFFNGLTHGVAMRRNAVLPKEGQGLMLGRGREGEEAQICLPRPLGHAAKECFQVRLPFFLGSPAGFRLQRFTAQHALQFGCRLPGL